MHLIIGGAYMGKFTHAMEAYHFSEEQVCDCEKEALRPASCVRHLEQYVLECVKKGEDPGAVFRNNREQWNDTVLICRDISGGVVPMDRQERLWREETGRLCQYLSREADRVSRIFCGLEQRLK